MRDCQVRAEQLVSKSRMSIQGSERIGEGGSMRKGWTHCGLGNTAIKVTALPKTPDATFRGEIFLQRTVKMGFDSQQELEFPTIFKFF